MKAIILAAGQGTRLQPLTNDRPKCLVELAGKSLLDHQLTVLRHAGIKDIHVVTGYRADQINYDDVTCWFNERYESTNMVSSLFVTENLMTGDADIIISYGDIVYEPQVLKALLECSAAVCIAVDRAWKQYWEARMNDPLMDAETLKLADGARIIELGKKPKSIDEIQGQYMGLIKIRADHVARLPAVWYAMDKNTIYDGKDFDNMYLTSFLQHLINTGWDVRAAFVENGWIEVDVPEDLEFASRVSWCAG